MNLTLRLTEQCNMDCAYCTRTKADRHMDGQTIAAACALAFSAGQTAGISFFGGEPLLRQQQILQALKDCAARSVRTGMRFRCKMTTNGTLLTEDFLRRAQAAEMEIGMSFDGCAQDVCRPFADGTGSYQVMAQKAALLLRYRPDACAMATVAPETADQYCDIAKSLYALGFRRIHMTPAYGRRVHWTDGHLQVLEEQLQRTADFYQARLLAGEKLSLGAFDSKIRDCIRGVNPASRCHLGQRQMQVAVDGRLYPCTQFVGDARFCFGDVFHGVHGEKQRRMIQQCSAPPVCEDCALKHRCTHACGCLNRLETGRADRVSAFQCSYEQLLIRQADQMAEQLYVRAPALFLEKYC